MFHSNALAAIRKKKYSLSVIILCGLCVHFNLIVFETTLLGRSRTSSHLQSKNSSEKGDQTKTPDSYKIIYETRNSSFKEELPLKYLINKKPQLITNKFLNEPVLQEDDKTYFMIFFIKSACNRTANRDIIRKTFSSINSINDKRFAFVFLTGRTTARCQESIVEEIEKFHDILQADVTDNYKNLPVKVLSAYQWIFHRHRDNSVFYAFTDDDCSINVLKIFKHFSKYQSSYDRTKKVICGYNYATRQVPNREPTSKYYTSFEAYPKHEFPTFCNGGLTVLTNAMFNAIYREAERTERSGIDLEDVYISGILRTKLGGGLSNIENFQDKSSLPFDKLVLHLGNEPLANVWMILHWNKQLTEIKARSENVSVSHNNARILYDVNGFDDTAPIR